MAKILLVEDTESNRDLISRFLRLYQYEVVTAVDGRQGLETALAMAREINLILMDMNLPELDGWEVTRRLKADPATSSLPVIALTAHAMVGDREKALAAGCDEYETKPVNFESLFHKMEALLHATSAA